LLVHSELVLLLFELLLLPDQPLLEHQEALTTIVIFVFDLLDFAQLGGSLLDDLSLLADA